MQEISATSLNLEYWDIFKHSNDESANFIDD